jgi:hypothetical protein
MLGKRVGYPFFGPGDKNEINLVTKLTNWNKLVPGLDKGDQLGPGLQNGTIWCKGDNIVFSFLTRKVDKMRPDVARVTNCYWI